MTNQSNPSPPIEKDESGEVGVVETPAGLFVGWIDVAWPSPHSPVPCLRGVVHLPVPEDVDVGREIEKARRKRRRARRSCRFCGEENLPGHMSGPDVCQGCAERELGVVH